MSYPGMEVKRATLHIIIRPDIYIPPTRFFVNGEGAGKGGHRHEYGLKTLRCENPRKPCGKRGPVEILRGDKMRARAEAIEMQGRRAWFHIELDQDYAPQLLAPEEPLIIIEPKEREPWLGL